MLTSTGVLTALFRAVSELRLDKEHVSCCVCCGKPECRCRTCSWGEPSGAIPGIRAWSSEIPVMIVKYLISVGFKAQGQTPQGCQGFRFDLNERRKSHLKGLFAANTAVSLTREANGLCSCFTCCSEDLRSPFLIPLAAGQRSSCSFPGHSPVQLTPVSLRGSGHLSGERLCYEVSFTAPGRCQGFPGLPFLVSSGLEGQAGKGGELSVLCGRMVYLGKLGTEQSLAWEQLFPLKLEDADPLSITFNGFGLGLWLAVYRGPNPRPETFRQPKALQSSWSSCSKGVVGP